MAKIIVILFTFLVFYTVKAVKELNGSKLEDKADIADNIKNNDDDEDESASIQVVLKNSIKNKVHTLLNDDNLHEKEEENYTVQVLDDNNSTKDSVEYKNFEDVISDSDDVILETNPEDKIEEVLTPSGTSIDEINDYSNRQEEIEIVLEQITKAYNHNEDQQEESSEFDKDDNNGRSAENFHRDSKEYSDEEENDEVGINIDDKDYSAEEYADKNISLDVKDRMDSRKPRRREHNMRPIDAMHYRPPDDRTILDSGPIRSFGEVVVPRLHPTLTRNGIVFTPTMYTMRTASPILNRLSGHSWMPNRSHMNLARDLFTRPQYKNKMVGMPQDADSKMIDDYNDYGSNTYSYAPGMKITTQASPQQIITPNQFDIFQKLVEASNQPKSSQRTFNDNLFPGNYYPERQYPESYGPFDVRRFRRNARDELPFQAII